MTFDFKVRLVRSGYSVLVKDWDSIAGWLDDPDIADAAAAVVASQPRIPTAVVERTRAALAAHSRATDAA